MPSPYVAKRSSWLCRRSVRLNHQSCHFCPPVTAIFSLALNISCILFGRLSLIALRCTGEHISISFCTAEAEAPQGKGESEAVCFSSLLLVMGTTFALPWRTFAPFVVHFFHYLV